ncbi:MAG: hypothetical protein PSV35_07215, partial [bacterium]|nr:hypothetical protein [bacterium]
FIKRKLESKETAQILIIAEPQYSGDAIIPDMMLYTLEWDEINPQGTVKKYQEVFNISLQSHQRFTKSMHESLSVLRRYKDAVGGKNCDESEDDELRPLL